MQISIKGHHLEVTAALSSYVHEQLNRLKQRLQGATHVSILIAGKPKNGKTPSIQILVHFAGKKVIRIKEYMQRSVSDFYTIITAAFDTLGINLNRRAGTSDKKHLRVRTSILRIKQSLV